MSRCDFGEVYWGMVVLTGDEDRYDNCQPSRSDDASYPGLSDCGERHDCCKYQDQRAEPEGLPPSHDL